MPFKEKWSEFKQVSFSTKEIDLASIRAANFRLADGIDFSITSYDEGPPVFCHGYEWVILLKRHNDSSVSLSLDCRNKLQYHDFEAEFSITWGPVNASMSDCIFTWRPDPDDEYAFDFAGTCYDVTTLSQLESREDEFWLKPSTLLSRSNKNNEGDIIKEIVINVKIRVQKTIWFPSYHDESVLRENSRYEKMLSTGEFSDLTFIVEEPVDDGGCTRKDVQFDEEEGQRKKRKTVKSVEFQAHRCLLDARVPEMLDIIYMNDEERRTASRIIIPSMKCHVFRILLTFIYTGTLEPTTITGSDGEKEIDPLDDEQTLVDLLTAANRLGCIDLKIHLESEIINRQLHLVEKFVPNLLLAESFNCVLLKHVLMDFFGNSKNTNILMEESSFKDKLNKSLLFGTCLE